jgi:hypothetical protein
VRRSPSQRWRRSFWLSAHRRAGASRPALLLLVSFIALGFVGGLLFGGAPGALGEVRFRWWALALGGLLFQVVLFAPPVAAAVGDLGPPLYVASTLAVLATLVRNLGQPWFGLIALGAGLNLLAIVANGGVMPADPAALAAVGLLDRSSAAFSNTAAMPHAAFAFLGDNLATPSWLPFANVLSIGDLFIGVGAAAWLATIMRRPLPIRLERRALAA